MPTCFPFPCFLTLGRWFFNHIWCKSSKGTSWSLTEFSCRNISWFALSRLPLASLIFKIQVFVICKIHQKLKISYNFHHIYYFSIFSWLWLQTEYLAPDPLRGNVSEWTHNLILGSETISGSKTQNLIPTFRADSWTAFEAPIRPLWLQDTTFDSEPAAASRL